MGCVLVCSIASITHVQLSHSLVNKTRQISYPKCTFGQLTSCCWNSSALFVDDDDPGICRANDSNIGFQGNQREIRDQQYRLNSQNRLGTCVWLWTTNTGCCEPSGLCGITSQIFLKIDQWAKINFTFKSLFKYSNGAKRKLSSHAISFWQIINELIPTGLTNSISQHDSDWFFHTFLKHYLYFNDDSVVI